MLVPSVPVIQPEPVGLSFHALDEELQGVARPGDFVQRVGRLGDHRRIAVRLPLEQLRQEIEGKMAEVVGDGAGIALTPCTSPGGRGETLELAMGRSIEIIQQTDV